MPRPAREPARLTDDQRDLAATCYGLALMLSGRAARRFPSLDDEIRGAATFGLLDAARTFDHAPGRKFSAWASTVIGQRIEHQFRYEFRGRRDRRRETAAHPDFDPPADPPPAPPPPDGLADALLAALPDREAGVLRGCVIEGRTLGSVGRRLGLTKERVRQIKVSALTTLRKHPSAAEVA